MSKKVKNAAEKMQKLAAELSDPKVMTPEEARKFYEEVCDNAEIMIEAIGEDLKALGRR